MPKDDIKIVVDVETTGLDFRREKIIELAAVKLVNNKITESYESLVNPMQHIRSSSINIHGITEEMILEAPTIEEVLPLLLDFIEDKPIIGHNVIFDYSFINHASLSLYGKELNNARIDTLLMFKEAFPNEPSHSLTSLLNRFGAKVDNAHRAMADAYALAEVYGKLRAVYEERYSWQLSQINNIHYLFERYLKTQSLIQSLQSEMGDIKSVFKIYFDEGGEAIEATTGEFLTCSTRQNYQYDIPLLKKVIDEVGISDKVFKINTGALERLINSFNMDEEIKEKLRNTRVNITESSTVVIQKPGQYRPDSAKSNISNGYNGSNTEEDNNKQTS
ncbi:MAG: 3'-5' exonuclease [Cyanobacteriota bacterium]